ncbi:MAG: hypothetical protein Q9208_007302 [Pyrenodesmia sp. 3 TL-2023]
MQVALRNKEDLLVQQALERIRRAQVLGKRNVKLTQPEIDALERKRRQDEARRTRVGSGSTQLDKRRSSGQLQLVGKDSKPGRAHRAGSHEEGSGSEDETDDDDGDYGVQVNFLPNEEGYEARRGTEPRPGIRPRKYPR